MFYYEKNEFGILYMVFLFQISGIVLDNFARGRCRHVWFSISADLRLDAQRFVNTVKSFLLLNYVVMVRGAGE